jgi:leader peptidase (prepilin peptidase)/N-methyltransferase
VTAAWTIVCGVLGLAVGSFLNVVIWRLPRGESIVRPPSRCPACGHRLTPAENVPVASWLVLRGRCRACRTRISVRYPVVELLTAGLWAAVGARFAGEPWAIPAYLVLASSLVALSAIDLDTMLLPNAIVYPTAAALAVLLTVASAGQDDWDALARAVGGAIASFALYFVLWFVVGGRALGYGDVRLAAVLGGALGWLGWAYVAWGLFLPFLVGAVAGMLIVVPWLALPMGAAGGAGAAVGVDVVEGWTGGDVTDPAAARTAVAVVAAVLAASILYLVLSAARRVPRGKALPFGPSMAIGAMAVVLLGDLLNL